MATAQLGTLLRHIHNLAARPRCAHESDRRLLDDFASRRDESAFTALVARHGPMVLRVCQRVLGHEQDAEDAFQATFLVLAKNSSSIRQREALPSWLHGVAYRTAMKAKRSAVRQRKHETRQVALGHGLPTNPRSNPADPSWKEVRAALDEEIQRLPSHHRSAFVACILEGKSVPEAAIELARRPGTVSSWLARARTRLRQRLARRGIELTGLLAAVAVAEPTRAAVPAVLAQSTIRFGLSVEAGKSAAGVIPSHIAALAAGVTRAMFVSKAKIAVALIFAVGLFAAGAGALAHQALAPETIETPAVQKSEAPATTGETAPKTAKDSAEEKGAAIFSGRVVDPEDKPVQGAKLHLIALSLFKPVHVETNSGTNGAFRLSVAQSEARRLTDESSWSSTCVVATAEGYGLAVSVLGAFKPSGDLTLRLAKDDVPINGRVLDLQGKPIAGVTVRVDTLSIPTAGDLTAWLKALEANPQDGYPIESRFLGSVNVREATQLFPAAVTDDEGRFRLTGIGRERLVALTLEGPTIVRSRVSARTRPGKRIDAAMFARNPEGGRLVYYGATFDHTAAPTRPIIGVVRDKDSGKPLAGVTIQSDRFAGTNVSGDSSVRTVTDKDGKYRLAGMAKGVGNSIKAAPAPDQPYLQSVREVEDAPGLEPVTVDFDLQRGVMVKGRVLDKATEKPVFANVQYLAFADNPLHKKVPGWAVDHYLQTSEDGAFQLVVLPGRGLLTARGWNDHYRMAVGADMFAKKDRYGDNGEFLLTAPHLCHPTTVHTLVEINPDEKAVLHLCDIVLDPGTMPHGTITAPDGKPLAGAKVLGLTAYGQWRNWTRTPLTSAEFTIYGLDVNEEREVTFFHESKKLAGNVKVRGDAKGPLTVKLEPWGTVTGRLVTADGKPQAGVLLQIADGAIPNNGFQTDNDGRFRIEGMTPGVAYSLDIVKNGKSAGRVFAGLAIKAGETKDLGDTQVKPLQ